MSELISGKEAKIAWANGEKLEIDTGLGFEDLGDDYYLAVFDRKGNKFRLKPRTITINSIEVPAPNYIETDPNLYGGWAINIGTKYYMYKSKRDYDAVIAALHGALGKK